jgi:ABC-type glycerol-3-phosphate transport system substrate-binding protein
MRAMAGLVAAALATGAAIGAVDSARAQDQQGMVTVMHYFTGELGRAGLNEIFGRFQAEEHVTVFDNPIGHEDFKTAILVMAAGGNLPDMFSYWAGARTQFVVDAGQIAVLDDLWAAAKLDAVVPASLAEGATLYDGKRYLIPFGYHYAGLFYNSKVMAEAGVTEFPTDWVGFVALCETLQDKGVTPIALGSKDRWPAQFWFDYLLLRTAGPDYRARLMAGEAAYTDPEVVHAMELWKELTDAGHFVEFANADTWTDAADKVARGEAAMTLMGTWITGYWNGNDLKPGEDYDFFPFPAIEDGVTNAVVGPVDGLLISADAPNGEQAAALAAFMLTDVEAQAIWATGQGALSPNKNVDPAIYTSVMKRALVEVEQADVFAFNYDLATPPPVAEVGLDLFARFMDDPAAYQAILTEAETAAKDAFTR